MILQLRLAAQRMVFPGDASEYDDAKARQRRR